MRTFTILKRFLLLILTLLCFTSHSVCAQGRLNLRWAHGGHFSSVNQVIYSPGGQIIATAGGDSSVKLWRASNGTLLRSLRPGFQVYCLAFSPDGKTLVTGGNGTSFRSWRVADGAPLASYLAGTSTLRLAYSPDGTLIASADNDKRISIWNVSDRTRRFPLPGHKTTASSLAFSPDGETLASSGEGSDHLIKFWNPITGDQIGGDLNTGSAIYVLAYSPDGKSFFSGHYDNTIKQWQTSDRSLMQKFPGYSNAFPEGHKSSVVSLSVSRDGLFLASGSWDRQAKLWRVSDHRVLNTFAGHSGYVQGVALSADNQTLITVGSDSLCNQWDASSGMFIRALTGHTKTVWGLAVSPDGKLVASGSEDRTLKIYRASTGELLQDIAAHTSKINTVAFSADSQRLATGSDDTTVKLWNVDGTLIKSLQFHTAIVTNVAFSPDNQTFASASRDKTVYLYNSQGTFLRSIPVGQAINAVAFTPDSRMVATATDDSIIRVWSVADGTQVGSGFQGTASKYYSVAFSSDGQTLGAGGSNGYLTLWNVSNHVQLNSIYIAYYPFAFAPDGKTLAAAGDAKVQIWNVADGTPLRYYDKGTEAKVYSVAYSSNGRFLAYGLADGTVALAETAPATQTVLLQHSQSDALFAFRFTGTAFTSGTLVWSGFGQGLQVVATPDLDGDGTPDLLLQSAATGLLYTFLLNDPQTQIKAYGPLLENGLPIAALPHWRVAATPDLNRDGKSDLVLQNSVTGDVYYFLMDGRSILKQGFLSRGVNPDARLFAMPDLNGDGTPDALFQLGTTGNLYRWILSGDGTTIAAQGFVFTAGFAAWRAITAKETNGDGGVKVLFQNPANRAVYEWNLIGGDLAGYGYPSLDYPSGWTATGFFDVNRDGRDDVLFQNEATGSLYFYGLDGLTLLTNGLLYVDTIPHWKVVPQR